jgi:SAM-dependent methyltransferase
LSEDLAGFWQTRYAQRGHTGWFDSAIYAYDQMERLAIVGDALERITPAPQTALDYGCGSGDFSRLLLRMGMRVWGFDPYVTPSLNARGFTHLSSPRAISRMDVPLDLILSVTVLDHVLSDDELSHILALFRSSISEGGALIFVEYALDTDAPRPASAYQAFRRHEEWQRFLDMAGFVITLSSPVPVYPASPSDGFRVYWESKVTKYLRGISNRDQPFVRLVRALLRAQARRIFARYGAGRVRQSPLRLMTARPRLNTHF